MSALPQNWEPTKLGCIIELAYGKGLTKTVRNRAGAYPVYGSNGIVDYHDSFLVEGPVIVVGRKGAAGVPTLSTDNCWPIDTTYFVKQSPLYDLNFMYYLLLSLRLDQFDRSTAIPGLNRDDAYALDIGLPPLNEQRRIVAKIEELFSELDKGIESLKTAREQLKVYRQAVLKHAFEGKLTANWREKQEFGKIQYITVDDASERIVDCLHSTPQFSNDGKACIDSTWIENNKVIFEQARYVSEHTYLERIKRLKPQKGDILFVREGSKKIGTTLVVEFDFDFCLGQRMMMFRLNKTVLPQYFAYYTQSDAFTKQYRPLIGGSASPHLNIRDIKAMKLPLCSLQEQGVIVNLIDLQFSEIDSIENDIDGQLQKSEVLRQSILKQAVSGKLVAQDPNDEPAAVMLERIKPEKSSKIKRKNAA